MFIVLKINAHITSTRLLVTLDISGACVLEDFDSNFYLSKISRNTEITWSKSYGEHFSISQGIEIACLYFKRYKLM